MEAPPPMEAPDAFDPRHPRFRNECRGLKSDPEWRCGELHDCRGHVQDRYPDGPLKGQVIPGSPWRPCRVQHPPGTPVCRFHGLTQATINAARELLASAAYEAADVQLDLLRDPDAAVRQRAVASVLDRSGVVKRELEPFDLVESIRRDPRSLRRLLVEIENDPELAAAIEAAEDAAEVAEVAE